jgi:site-specific DNA-methyltransferase (adenine-specific)
LLPLDTIICGNNVDVLRSFPDECIDLTVTSPPYDNLRNYNGYSFDFEGIAQELWRVTKHGGVVVWVVGDATVNGSETGTSFRQALRFMGLGFNLHDTMIWEKASRIPTQDRYYNVVEYMFVFSKGRPKAMNFIVDHKNATAGTVSKKDTVINKGAHQSDKEGRTFVRPEYSRRSNIWRYGTGGNGTGHPAIFPEALARDHILSWSNEGDVVLDPFSGSGTTAKMALLNGRHYIGIDVSEEYCEIARKRIEAARVQQQSRPSVEQAVLF